MESDRTQMTLILHLFAKRFHYDSMMIKEQNFLEPEFSDLHLGTFTSLLFVSCLIFC